eukprot:2449986-Amphidinium_carterae.1
MGSSPRFQVRNGFICCDEVYKQSSCEVWPLLCTPSDMADSQNFKLTFSMPLTSSAWQSNWSSGIESTIVCQRARRICLEYPLSRTLLLRMAPKSCRVLRAASKVALGRPKGQRVHRVSLVCRGLPVVAAAAGCLLEVGPETVLGQGIGVRFVLRFVGCNQQYLNPKYVLVHEASKT